MTAGSLAHPVATSIVVPAYQERERLPLFFEALESSGTMAPPAGGVVELIVVDDGSTDGTADFAAAELARLGWVGDVARFRTNTGKGAALKVGMAMARGAELVMMDADLATDLEALPLLSARLGHAAVVVGSRQAPGAAVIDDPLHRRAMGLRMRTGVRTISPIAVTDSQCGFKGFRGPVGRLLFHLSLSNRFGQDVELLNFAHLLGLRVEEVPVQWTSIPGSKVHPVRDARRTVREVVMARARGLPAERLRALSVAVPIDEVRPLVRAIDLVAGDASATTVVLPGSNARAVAGLTTRLALDFGHRRVTPARVAVATLAADPGYWFGDAAVG